MSDVTLPTNISLRDWFAGQALAAILTDPEYREMLPSDIAEDAYVYADKMLEARALKSGAKP